MNAKLLPLAPSPSSADRALPSPQARGAARGLDATLKWFDRAPGPVALLAGSPLACTYANAAFRRVAGTEKLVGVPFFDAFPELAHQAAGRLLAAVARGAEACPEGPLRLQLAANAANAAAGARHLELVLQPVADASGAVAGVLLQGTDVSLEAGLRRDLDYCLTHDRLTGLPNYMQFRERLQVALAAAGDDGRLLVVALDLDRFKRVNACFGHEAGDRILAMMAARLQAAAGASATIARENGDKFLLLLDAAGVACETELSRALMAAVAAPLQWAGRDLHVTCSAGLALYPLDGADPDALLAAADRALHRAREGGGGQARRVGEPGPPPELARFHLGAALRTALERGMLEVHYQPQLDLLTGKISGVEALVRWNDPVLGAVDPATLVGVAEESGLIEVLGAWVLRTACAQAQQWRLMGFPALRVAVNLSARQFARHGLEAMVVRTLADTGLPPACLELELTESSLMVDVEHALECLGSLKQRGVRLSLDDFGTGYSSLAYLRRFPIDVLKIDKSFLHKVPESEQASAIVEAIITMGHSLGMRVIAEGVEHEIQCDFLSRNMCDEVQGFFFSRALVADQLTQMLQAERSLPAHLLRLNRRKANLLLVDDEPSILASLKRLLRHEGYHILTAANGEQGLRILAEHPVDVIVSDQRMPGMTGVEFLRTVRQLYPDTVRIVLSGYTELQTVTDAVNAGAIYKFLTKPWDDDQLREHLREAFLHRAMANENRLLALEVQTANQQMGAVNRRLEQVLARQRREIERGEASLDVVQEALRNVPMPVLAIDDSDTVVLANRAALRLFHESGLVLGADARRLIPDLPSIAAGHSGGAREIRIGAHTYRSTIRPMGNSAQPRGWLVAVTGVWSDE